ncbi:bifunctional metallophosphatase/5'-nucleotidase [Oceanibacterium hippocampi]|uniref:Trifunctional nucleotide phosphoesterase protein YfkN n=1 Tax=Oceanibacterium hippocampi TaxID=745714 RepID=A0A1Y5TVY2_9PROT|nr:5'-nucleotidase C-terminal domain-containing protein [Oceanibacterium hippocampi]SLN74686.1 Trifunctional nucleotide phosphoesterase protein YfkN precursor [Oceanibacterium hippocampi]
MFLHRIWLFLALTLAIAVPGLPAQAADSARFTIVHVADVDQFADPDGRGGLAAIMTVLERERRAGPPVFFTHGGDLVSPSLLASIDKGAHMVALMNAMGLDLMTLGNHEFDFGPAILKARMAEAEFQWLSANVTEEGAPIGGAVPTATRMVGDHTIGFLGLTTTTTPDVSSPGATVAFADPVAAAQQAVAALKAAGAVVIVALTHQDLADDRRLAREVPEIDVILGGHDHEPITFYDGDAFILKPGSQGRYAAVVDVVLDSVDGRDGPRLVITPSWRMTATDGIEPSPAIAALTGAMEARLDTELGHAVGVTRVELDSRRSTVREREAAIGNLIADAMRDTMRADIALTNGGGIRGDRLYASGSTLSRRDVLGELPFGNRLVLLRISGAALRAALENGFSAIADRAGRFPQVSGMRVVYDPARPAGDRVVSVTVGNAPLDPAARYRLATNDFLARGGDGYVAFLEGEVLVDGNAGPLMAGAVADRIAGQGTVAPVVEGRITAR